MWLVGCWINVKVSPSLRPSIYECLILLLQPTEDTVVRLEAAQTLKFDILYLYHTIIEGILSCLFGHAVSISMHCLLDDVHVNLPMQGWPGWVDLAVWFPAWELNPGPVTHPSSCHDVQCPSYINCVSWFGFSVNVCVLMYTCRFSHGVIVSAQFAECAAKFRNHATYTYLCISDFCIMLVYMCTVY